MQRKWICVKQENKWKKNTNTVIHIKKNICIYKPSLQHISYTHVLQFTTLFPSYYRMKLQFNRLHTHITDEITAKTQGYQRELKKLIIIVVT